MSYGLIYTVSFATLEGVPCVVEIEKEDYTGGSTELTAGDTPFVTDIDDEEFLYTPTRFSTAKLTVVSNDYLQSLFSTAYKQYRVTLKVNEVVTWCGFVKPELYTQDYSSDTFTLEIECMSAMSVLEFMDYATEEENKNFVSIWTLLQKCIIASSGKYNAIYIPHVYASSLDNYNTDENVLDDMTISEQNFFDEDDKVMKLGEVLAEVCKFLNWTCVDWKGELYFMDLDHSGIYHKYNINLENYSNLGINEVEIQNIGFRGSNHSLDVLPGYNKVTLKCSNYSIGEIFQDDDYDEMQVLATEDETEDNKINHKLYQKANKAQMRAFIWVKDHVEEVTNINDYKDNPSGLNALFGAIPVRYCIYETKDGKPTISDYNFTNAIQVRQRLGTLGVFQDGQPMIIVSGATSSYSDGALAISGSIRLCYDNQNMSPLYDSKVDKINIINARVRIGDNYYDGGLKKWGKDSKSRCVMSNEVGQEYCSIKNTKTLDMPYTGLSGYVIPIDGLLHGDIEITIFAPIMGYNGDFKIPYGYYLKDFKVVYQKKDGISQSDNSADRIYENILNDKYINELDEIELKISSYNNDGACHSKVMLDGNYLTDNLYNIILNKNKRPEELLITRIINHYSTTRIKLTQVIRNSEELHPFTVLSDTFMVDKKFINVGGSIDYKMNRFECIMIEV